MALPAKFKPMKGEAAELSDIRTPCFASPKLDGVRCIIFDGVAYSASGEPHNNRFLQAWALKNAAALDRLDGEIAVGDPWDPEVFKNTSGRINSPDGEPDFTFWLFDVVYEPSSLEYRERKQVLDNFRRWHLDRVQVVPVCWCETPEDLAEVVSDCTSAGYEGAMVRSPEGPYKFGRSTIKEGYLLKVKEFIDNEAEIIGVVEEMRNTNKAEKDALGRTKRSTSKAGKVGKGTLGKFLCRGLNGQFKGVEFSVGTGVLTKQEKQELWNAHYDHRRDTPDGQGLVGQCITFKHMKHNAGYSKPRHAGFLRFRPRIDICVDY